MKGAKLEYLVSLAKLASLRERQSAAGPFNSPLYLSRAVSCTFVTAIVTTRHTVISTRSETHFEKHENYTKIGQILIASGCERLWTNGALIALHALAPNRKGWASRHMPSAPPSSDVFQDAIRPSVCSNRSGGSKVYARPLSTLWSLQRESGSASEDGAGSENKAPTSAAIATGAWCGYQLLIRTRTRSSRYVW